MPPCESLRRKKCRPEKEVKEIIASTVHSVLEHMRPGRFYVKTESAFEASDTAQALQDPELKETERLLSTRVYFPFKGRYNIGVGVADVKDFPLMAPMKLKTEETIRIVRRTFYRRRSKPR